MTRSSSGTGVPFWEEGDGLDRQGVKEDRVSRRVGGFGGFGSWEEVVGKKDSFRWS